LQADAAKQGIPLERIAGDGKGVLPNGQKTPEYADLVKTPSVNFTNVLRAAFAPTVLRQ
jgi:hypothetical protein